MKRNLAALTVALLGSGCPSPAEATVLLEQPSFQDPDIDGLTDIRVALQIISDPGGQAAVVTVPLTHPAAKGVTVYFQAVAFGTQVWSFSFSNHLKLTLSK